MVLTRRFHKKVLNTPKSTQATFREPILKRKCCRTENNQIIFCWFLKISEHWLIIYVLISVIFGLISFPFFFINKYLSKSECLLPLYQALGIQRNKTVLDSEELLVLTGKQYSDGTIIEYHSRAGTVGT